MYHSVNNSYKRKENTVSINMFNLVFKFSATYMYIIKKMKWILTFFYTVINTHQLFSNSPYIEDK